jgi:23S rRNA A2030 N6-methylase RlmJ
MFVVRNPYKQFQLKTMAYDHSRKIGNRGDVVKHSVLHNCVTHLLSHSAENETFVYAESHCGRAGYILPKGGEWKHGIGLLSSKTNEAREACPRIQAYFQSSLSSRMKVGQQYFGSSNIVFRCLRSKSRKFRFELHETDVHAYNDLTRFYAPWSADIHLLNSDGYEGIRNLTLASLVLIDPPSLDSAQISQCISHLREQKIPYICWTPRNSSSSGNKRESQISEDFGKLTGLGTHFPIRWANPCGAAQNTFGCRLTVSDDLVAIVNETTSQLTTIFSENGWIQT